MKHIKNTAVLNEELSILRRAKTRKGTTRNSQGVLERPATPAAKSVPDGYKIPDLKQLIS